MRPERVSPLFAVMTRVWDFFPSADTMKEIQSGYEQSVSEMLFKVAVEVSKTNHVLTDYLRFPKNYLKGLTASVAQEVAETNGIIHIEDRAKYDENHAETDY